jgi:hypothetical protein
LKQIKKGISGKTNIFRKDFNPSYPGDPTKGLQGPSRNEKNLEKK